MDEFLPPCRYADKYERDIEEMDRVIQECFKQQHERFEQDNK